MEDKTRYIRRFILLFFFLAFVLNIHGQPIEKKNCKIVDQNIPFFKEYDPQSIINCYNQNTTNKISKIDFIDALLFQKKLEVADSIFQKIPKLNSPQYLLLKGKLKRKKGIYSDALNINTEALNKVKDRKIKIDILIERCRIFINTKDLTNIKSSLNRISKINFKSNLQNSHFFYLKSAYSYLIKDYEEALFFGNKAEEIQLKDSLNYSLFYTKKHLGNIQLHLFNYNEADKYFNTALTLVEGTNRTDDYLELQNDLGNYYSEFQFKQDSINPTNNREFERLAIKHFKEGAEMADSFSNYEYLQLFYFNLAYTHDILGKDSTALNYFYKYDEALISWEKQREQKLTKEIETKYHTKEVERENEIYFQQLILVGAASILLLILLTILAHFFRKTRRLNAQISAQKTELEELNGFKNQLFAVLGHDLRGMMSKLHASQRKLERGAKKTEGETFKKTGIRDGWYH